MYYFANISAYNNTLNSTFVEILKMYDFINTKNSKITDTKVHKMVHLVCWLAS